MSYTLTFSQLIGEFVTDKELLGAQDPYVIFEAGGRKCQTKAIKSAGSGTCEWKETYTLNEFTPKSSSSLEVTVYNHNTLRPDGTLGSGTVNLSNLGQNQLSGSGDRVNVPLTDKKGKNVGTLRFIIHGGGYSGSGNTSSGYGSSTGTTGQSGSGIAGGTGTGVGHHGHHQHGSGTGIGSGTGSGTGGTITGVGAGSDYGLAKSAADKAAHENRDVTIQGREGEVAAGRPTHTGTGTTGVTDNTRSTTHNESGQVIDRKFYTGVEDRPQEQALVEQYREHNPYAKQYETTVQHTGRERLVGSSIEALGTTERVIGQDHVVHGQAHDHIARALPKGAVADRPGGEGWVQGKAGPICDSTTFEVTGDRTVDMERVTNLREHREFEKEFEVKTQLTGERNLERGANTEQLNRERVLLDEKNKNACAGHPNVDAAGTNVRGPTTSTGVTSGTTGTGYGTGSGTSTGTGYGSGVSSGTGGVGSGTTGTGYGTGTGTGGVGSGSGTTGTDYGSSTTGTGYGTGTGTTGTGLGSGTTGTGHHGTGTGTGSNAGGGSVTQKLASFVPGTEANKEKKAAQGGYN